MSNIFIRAGVAIVPCIIRAGVAIVPCIIRAGVAIVPCIIRAGVAIVPCMTLLLAAYNLTCTWELGCGRRERWRLCHNLGSMWLQFLV